MQLERDTMQSEQEGSAALDIAATFAAPSLAIPTIRRTGIQWTGGLAGHPLAIQLTFENRTPRATRPSVATVQLAPFGAFVPWQPLTSVAVPSIPPGGRTLVKTAVGGDDYDRRLAPSQLLWRARDAFPDWGPQQDGSGRPTHLVGNLNVFVDRGEPVERHFNRSIGLVPGADNIAMFFVGDGKTDHYTFRYLAEPESWDVEITSVPWNEPVFFDSESLLLQIRPPAEARQGRLTLWVERRSTGQRVPIEFELSTEAPPAECLRF